MEKSTSNIAFPDAKSLELPFPEEDWRATPVVVQLWIIAQLETIGELRKRTQELERRLNLDSSNSDRPPSSDSPYRKAERSDRKRRKPSKKRKHRGSRQQLLEPTEVHPIHPEQCRCGCREFESLEPYYTHQHIELPEILMQVIHFILYKGRCRRCGRVNKGYIPSQYRTGFGPRFSALVVELAGIAGNSRTMVRTFCSSVLGVPISLGAIQKIIDRASKAIKPHYEAIRDKARSSN